MTIIDLNIDDRIEVPLLGIRGTLMNHHFQVGSVQAFWEKDGLLSPEEVEAKVKRALDRGEHSHFAFNLGVTITAHRQEPITYVPVNVGDTVRIDQQLFTVTEAPNYNLILVPAGDGDE